jgi:hypothetical protein
MDRVASSFIYLRRVEEKNRADDRPAIIPRVPRPAGAAAAIANPEG